MTIDHQALEKSLRLLSNHVLGRSSKTRAARMEEVQKSGATAHGIVGFAPSTRVVRGRMTETPALRVIVDKKQKPETLARRGIRSLPKKVGGMGVDVVSRLNAMAFGPASVAPGVMVKAALSQQYGSLTCVLSSNGDKWIVCASHVLAPGDVSASDGDSELVSGSPVGTLHAWDRLVVGTSTSSDVAVAKTSLAATTAWGDGSAFAGTRDYNPGNGPFRVFGAVTASASGSGAAIRNDGVDIDVPAVGPVTYASIALLSFATSAGDSGAPVRDAAGYLVGMVVGGTASGKTAITPWQAVGPAIASLVS